MQQNIEFNLRVSRFYFLFLALMLAGSAAIVIVLPLAWWMRGILFCVLMGYGAVIFWRYALLRSKDSIIRLRKLDGKCWQITTGSAVFEATPRGDSTVTPVVSILRVDMPGRRQPLASIILKDSLPAGEYRRLIGMLRMG